MKPTPWAWVWLSLCSLLASGCQERLFNNPLDPGGDTGAYELKATLNLAGIVPEDLAFSGDALWVCDSFGRVYALNYDSGQVIRELNVEQSAAGVAYDGSYLWLAVRGTTSLQRVNIITGALIREVRLPRGDISGIDWYGGRLYVADRLSNSVLVVDDLTGVVERTLAHPGISLDGVATDGRDLWTADGAQMAIYRQDLLSAAIAPFTAPDRTPSGLCASNGFVWLGDRSGRVFKLRFP